MSKAIAPLSRRSGQWWIDTTELLGESCPEYGGYDSKDEAEEDRAPVVSKIRARRKLGITDYEPQFELSASELKLAVQLLGKYTKGTFIIERIKTVEQVKEINLMLAKWAGERGWKAATPLASYDTTRALLYKEIGIDESWPEAEHQFIEWAKRFSGSES